MHERHAFVPRQAVILFPLLVTPHSLQEFGMLGFLMATAVGCGCHSWVPGRGYWTRWVNVTGDSYVGYSFSCEMSQSMFS
ncbi:hypothetical protein HDV63DRAFT_381873 [Trichoderma sp. SZMC 28014]